MVQKRGLKDAVNDPLAEKKPAAVEKDRKKPKPKSYLVTIAAALIGGFIGGLLTGRFIRFRL